MSTFPYTYFHCPCAESLNPESSAEAEADTDNGLNNEDEPFNPHSARSNFSLFPPEHLMWCEACHEIRCPRCVVEEIVCWYCPGCGFEVAGSIVRSEGNRCTRNCFNCPCCTAGLFVSSLDGEGAAAPWILECQHCNWTSLDIEITFDKPNNIHGQLSKMLGKARSKVSLMLDRASNEAEPPETVKISRADPDTRFASLMAFYRSELARESPGDSLFTSLSQGGADYSSPSSFARIMSLYTNTGSYGRKAAGKAAPMRGAVDISEGLAIVDELADEKAINLLRSTGLSQTINTEQRISQPHNPRFQHEMVPQATLLCTKRSRRCRTCRHILVKPESKVSATRYKIKLLALNHIPSMTLKSLTPLPSTLSHLPANKPLQFLLTLRNPMFEAVKVSLATPAQTPGPRAHSITILCPAFTLGANSDVWDESLGISLSNEGRRNSKILKPNNNDANAEDSRVAEAGKVWERGRNWTTVVVEIVCRGENSLPLGGKALSFAASPAISAAADELEAGEDDDILEIPLFVRLEYEQSIAEGGTSGLTDSTAASTAVGVDGSAAGGETSKRMRELAYWAVLGVGKVDSPVKT